MIEATTTAMTDRFNSTIIQRVQAVTLLENGIAVKIVAAITEISQASVYKWRKTVKNKDWDSAISNVLKKAHLIDAFRSDRSFKVTDELKKTILNNVRSSKNEKKKISTVCVFYFFCCYVNDHKYWIMNTIYHLLLFYEFSNATICEHVKQQKKQNSVRPWWKRVCNFVFDISIERSRTEKMWFDQMKRV